MFAQTRSRVFEIMESPSPRGLPGWVVQLALLGLILANVAAVVLETVEPLAAHYGRFFRVLQRVSMYVFTVEYLLRLWACTAGPAYARPLMGRLRFALRPLTLIDLLVLVPFYLPLHGLVDLRFLRGLRLLRLLVLLKFGRYSEALRAIGAVVWRKREQLWATMFVVVLLVLISSSLMYMVENSAQPKVFSSIPAAMWWAVVTMTTVGYGDAYPITPTGKFLASVIAFLGIGLFALPAGIIASGFAEGISREEPKADRCPHCGRVLD